MAKIITMYSDYLCPYCYLGKASLEEYLNTVEDEPGIEWCQFDLFGYDRGPDGEVRKPIDEDKTNHQLTQRNIDNLAEEYDVDMLDLREIPSGVDSWDAQKLGLFVQRAYDTETFEAVHDALFDAVWQEGRHIGDGDVLVEIAAAEGIPKAEAREAIADETLDSLLAERFEAARRHVVTGVPTFVSGEERMGGAIPPAEIEKLVEGD